MKILSMRHDFPEKSGFKISRPIGRKDYTFLHFKQKITIIINQEHIVTEPNACIIFAPDTPQLFFSEAADITHNWMHFTPDCARLLEKYDIPVNQIFYPKDTAFISELFYKIETEFYSNRPFKEDILNGYFREFLIRLSRNLNYEKTEIYLSANERKVLQEIRHTVLASPEHQWTVEEMANNISLSPSRFHAVYKAMFGISPMKDVIENRIQNAKNLLVSTDMTVLQIGERVGYTNPHHFIRQFKAITSETPLHYRQIYTK